MRKNVCNIVESLNLTVCRAGADLDRCTLSTLWSDAEDVNKWIWSARVSAGLPDPFAKVVVDGSGQCHSTDTVKSTLDPKWNQHYDLWVSCPFSPNKHSSFLSCDCLTFALLLNFFFFFFGFTSRKISEYWCWPLLQNCVFRCDTHTLFMSKYDPSDVYVCLFQLHREDRLDHH